MHYDDTFAILETENLKRWYYLIKNILIINTLNWLINALINFRIWTDFFFFQSIRDICLNRIYFYDKVIILCIYYLLLDYVSIR